MHGLKFSLDRWSLILCLGVSAFPGAIGWSGVNSAYAQEVPAAVRVEQYFDQAKVFVADGKYQESLVLLDQISRLDTKLPKDIYFYYGNNHYQLGDYKSAVESFEHYLAVEKKTAPLYPEAMRWISVAEEKLAESAQLNFEQGRAFYEQGKFTDAIQYFNVAISSRQADNDVYLDWRGYAYHKAGGQVECMADLNKAISLSPKRAAYFKHRSDCHWAMGDPASALNDLNSAVALAPENAQYHNARGTAHYSRGAYRASLWDFSRAIEIESGLVAAYSNRGEAYRQLGEWDNAILDHSQSIALVPSAAHFNNRGHAYRGAGNFERSISDYRAAVKLQPGNAVYRANRGMVRLATGVEDDVEEAVEDFDEALEIDGGNAEYYAQRGRAYLWLGDFKDARKDFNQAVALRGDVQDIAVRGEHAFRMGNFAEAIEDFGKAINLSVNNGSPNSYLIARARVRIAMGDAVRSAADLDSAIANGANDTQTFMIQAWGKFLASDTAGAAEALERANSGVEVPDIRGLLLEAVLQARQGGDWRSWLGSETSGRSLSLWPGPIVAFLLGDMSRGDLRRAARHESEWVGDTQLCEVNYFIGERALWDGDIDDAETYFGRAARSSDYSQTCRMAGAAGLALIGE